MTTLTRPRTRTRTADHRRRPQPRYRPANTPRTTARLPSSPAPTPRPAPTPVTSPLDHRIDCEACARTRRFERRVGQLLRRGLVLGACALVALATASLGSVDSAPTPTKATPASPGSSSPRAEQLATPADRPAWCAVGLVPGPGCPPPTTSATGETPFTARHGLAEASG